MNSGLIKDSERGRGLFRQRMAIALVVTLVAVVSVALASIAGASDEATRRLLIAADRGDVNAIRAALTDGARIDESSVDFAGADRQPPLVAAALRGHQKAVRLLLKEGADPLAVEKDGYNAWHAAGFQGRVGVLRVLVELETHGYGLHKDGFSPLHRACWGRTRRHTEAVRFLITEAGRACGEPARNGKMPIDLTKNRRTAEILRKCPATNEAKARVAPASGPAESAKSGSSLRE